MRNLKKVLSLTLAMVMLIGMMVMGAGAANFTDEGQIGAAYKEAAEVMNAIGIFTGSDGAFLPQGLLKRSEATKILVFVTDGAAVANALGQSATQFTDVPATHWASGYVAYCANRGIVGGKAPTIFDPDGQLTVEQFAKMLLVAMGSDESRYVGTAFSGNTMRDAMQAKLNEGVSLVQWNVAITREQACKMALNALTKTLEGGKVQYPVTFTDGRDPMYFDNTKDAALYATMLHGTLGKPVVDTTGTLGEKNFGLKQETKTDKLGDRITQWTANGDVEVIIDRSSDALITVSGADFKYDANNKSGTLKGYKYANVYEYTFNGETTKSKDDDDTSHVTAIQNSLKNMAGRRGATLKFYGSDKTINKIVIEEPYFTTVTKVDTKKNIVTLRVYNSNYTDGKTLSVGEEDGDYSLVKDMAKDDVFMGIYMPGWDEKNVKTDERLLAIDGIPEDVEGKVTASRNNNVSVDGTSYTYASEYGNAAKVALKTEGTFYIYNDYVYRFVQSSAAEPEDYALIINKAYSAGSGLDASASMQVRALLSDGTVGVYDVAIDDDGNAGGEPARNGEFEGKIFAYSIDSDNVMELYAPKASGKGSVAEITGYKGGNSGTGSVLFNSKTVYVLYTGTGSKTKAEVITGVSNLGSFTEGKDGQVVLGDSKVVNIAFIAGSTDPVSSGNYAYVDAKTQGTELIDDEIVYSYEATTPSGDTITVYGGKNVTTGVYNLSDDDEIVGKAFAHNSPSNCKIGPSTVVGELIRVAGSNTWYTITEETQIVAIHEDADVDDYSGADVILIMDGNTRNVETIFITSAKPAAAE